MSETHTTDDTMAASDLWEMESIVANAPLGVLLTAERHIVRYNYRFAEMFGFIGDEGVGKHASTLYPSVEAYEALGRLAAPLLSSGSSVQTELYMRRQNGEQLWVELVGYVLNPERASDGTVWFVEDRTRWLSASMELQRALQENEMILDNALVGIAVLNNRHIVRCNKRMCEIFGYSFEEIHGASSEMLYASHLAFEEIGTAIYEALGRCGTYTGEHQMLRKNRDRVWCHLSGRAMSPGNPFGESIWIFDDISDRKRAESSLAEAKLKAESATEAKSMFLANMGHEIRTPMNAIIGLSHLMQKTELTTQQRDYANKIHRAGTLLLGVINDILDISKIEAGQISLETVCFQLDEVLEDLVAVIGSRAREKGLELLFDVSPAIPKFLLGDRLRLSQVLTNLVSNAVKFTEAGVVSVSVSRLDEKSDSAALRFEIRDTGIGISQTQLTGLFRPFAQADGSITRKYGGTGLGLSICKHLVALMGGEIEVSSTPDEGSIFSFTVEFRLKTADHSDAQRKKLPEHLGGMRALVVDNNAAASVVLSRQLEALGLRVDTVNSGATAVAAIVAECKLQPYQMVFVDLGISEIDMILEIRTAHSLTVLPSFVLVSALGREEVSARAKHVGIDYYLIKPVNVSALEDALLTLYPPGAGETPGKPTAAERQRPPALNGMRILLAEDNEINRQIAVELLKSAGATVETANNGQEAIDQLNSDTAVFDVVLMDLQMPVMGGYEAARLIRIDPRFKRLPIVAMTAHALAEDRQRCLDFGMQGHLAKPIDPDELFRTLSTLGKRNLLPPDTAMEYQRPGPMPQIDGLDSGDGLRRCGGKPEVYRKLLHQFCDSQMHVIRDIRIALKGGHTALAARLAHTLKGVAGNVGALRIAELANATDNVIRYARTPRATRRCLATLESEMSKFCSDVADILSDGRMAPRAEDPPLTEILKDLIPLLRQCDGDAVELMSAHEDVFRRAMLPSDFNRLSSALRNYDYIGALRLIGTFETHAATERNE